MYWFIVKYLFGLLLEKLIYLDIDLVFWYSNIFGNLSRHIFLFVSITATMLFVEQPKINWVLKIIFKKLCQMTYNFKYQTKNMIIL